MSVVNLNFSKSAKIKVSHYNQPTLVAYLLQRSNEMESEGRWGTARNYLKTARSLNTFIEQSPLEKNGKATDHRLGKLDSYLLLKYQHWLFTRGVKRNTVSFYMRVIRAAFNHAMRYGKITGHNGDIYWQWSDLTCSCLSGKGRVSNHISNSRNLFSQIYTGIDKTSKRAVREETIYKLSKLDLRHSRPLQLTRDLFIFSYCARGISFIDLVFLKKSNISNGILSYSRRKTGQRLTIAIEPCMQRILDKYMQAHKKKEGEVPTATMAKEYIFPIITAIDEKEAYRQYQTALGYYNRKLKQLSGLMGGDIKLSSYSARHSWATTARDHNIPISVISAGMGHTSERTTQIYLQQLEGSIIDKANRNLLRRLNFK